MNKKIILVSLLFIIVFSFTVGLVKNQKLILEI